ncbi:hypothetical protein BO99DRAFT_62767 [Aspergillus violaceofuscus CBS 115571]|uniref:Uncharacterized protein n=1 Tax=Aspergillus violaceofuscus (strain CBS 115571) TaxID=1450538 RepID=A0A2V5HK03_ASPV1|nr:hypothetical protein BO99DRAFT_62767 [Aspergillus violaceofuscus CBS 115571]
MNPFPLPRKPPLRTCGWGGSLLLLHDQGRFGRATDWSLPSFGHVMNYGWMDGRRLSNHTYGCGVLCFKLSTDKSDGQAADFQVQYLVHTTCFCSALAAGSSSQAKPLSHRPDCPVNPPRTLHPERVSSPSHLPCPLGPIE